LMTRIEKLTRGVMTQFDEPLGDGKLL
jgi:hypothetical protein